MNMCEDVLKYSDASKTSLWHLSIGEIKNLIFFSALPSKLIKKNLQSFISTILGMFSNYQLITIKAESIVVGEIKVHKI